MRKIIPAVSALMGTIIGAGIFGIPYVIKISGLLIGIILIILISALVLVTMLYLGEIALRTKSNHHLTGYAEKYLGRKGKIIMLMALAFGIYAAILAYIIGVSESLSYLIYNNPAHALFLGISFWLFLSLLSYFGLKALEKGEFIGVSAIFILIISMAIFFINKLNLSNFAQSSSQNILAYLAPFGVILFAFLGYTTIPEVKKILSSHKNKMKSSIILAIFLSALIYILFTIIVIGVNGKNTPQIATVALGKPFMLLGLLTMSTAYLALSISLIDMFHLDFNQPKAKSWFFTISIPLILFIFLSLTNSANFTKVLGISGAVSGGITSILILLMADKAKYLGDRKPEYSIPINKFIIFFLSLIFVIGALVELIT